MRKIHLEERVVICVRNGKYETFKSTLDYFPNTLLGCEERRNKYLNHSSGEYHFDVSSDVFDAVLFFYQSRGILVKPESVNPTHFWDALLMFQLVRLVDNEPVFPKIRWKRDLWIVMEHPELSFAAKIMALFTVIVVMGSVIVFCLETLYITSPATGLVTDGWFYCELGVNIFFTFDYGIRLLTVASRREYVLSAFGIIDLGCIIPFYMLLILMSVKHSISGQRVFAAIRGLRLLKVLRIFKFIRYSKALRNQAFAIYKSRKHMALLLTLFVIGVIFFAATIQMFEESKNPMFDSLAMTAWFVAITMTTVGYGDIVPITFLGKISTVFTILAGQVLIFYLFLPIYSKFFQEYFEDGYRDRFELIPISELRPDCENKKFKTSFRRSLRRKTATELNYGIS